MSKLKDRIEELQTKMKWDDLAMSVVAGVSRSAVAQWRGQGSKIIHSIGNMQAAENLERATGCAALWIAKGEGPKHVSGVGSTGGKWPFRSIDESKVRGMDDMSLAQLEAAALIAAAQVGLDIKRDR